jgi:hypothetical protein
VSKSDRARYARANHIFFRHVGKETKDVYFRVNPQAIRVQQQSKGSVVDTLGGYFREILYSDDPERNGLMLPDLTIECDTGAGYRKELQKLEWIWRNHGTPKEDGSPADTYFMDMADEDTLWFDGASPSSPWTDGGIGSGLPQGTDPTAPTNPALTQAQLQKAVDLKRQYKSSIAKTLKGSRFVPRCYRVEILSFAWDESVQDPYRIRFNFRCKILKDEFWPVDQPPAEGTETQSIDDWTDGGVNPAKAITSKASMVEEALKKSTDFPLNIAAAIATVQNTVNIINSVQATVDAAFNGNINALLSPILWQLTNASGIGDLQMLNNAANQGWSIYDASLGKRLYWRSEFSGVQVTQSITQQLQALYPILPTLPRSPAVRTGVQVGSWSPAAVDGLSAAVQTLSILGVKI